MCRGLNSAMTMLKRQFLLLTLITAVWADNIDSDGRNTKPKGVLIGQTERNHPNTNQPLPGTKVI